MSIVLKAAKRAEQGTGASRRLRRTGRVPGILYGGGREAEQITVDHNEVYHLLKQESFHASVLTMDIDGAAQAAILRDVQVHPYKIQVLHLDFQRVDAAQKIHVKVPLHFKNAELSPGVKLQGGIASHVLNELDVTCLPGDLPEFIEVDLAHLTSGHSMHVSEIPMPKGVEPVLHKGEDPVIASITMPRGGKADEQAADEAAPAAASPEPAKK